MKVRISKGNTKMGGIPSVSLTPCKTCAKDAPCKKTCYAMKAYRQYPATRNAYNVNTRLANSNRAKYFAQIEEYLTKAKPHFFRWHVAGDILDYDYLLAIRCIAAMHTSTKFLLFTKRYDLANKLMSSLFIRPTNLSIVLSAWPGYKLDNPYCLPVAYMIPKNGTEPRCPSDAIECPGNCESCGACFSLSQIGRDVAFHQH